MHYRRSNVPGSTFFFTVNLADRSSRVLTNHIDVLRHSVRRVQRSHPFDIVAMVVLPDHLHAIWSLPCGDCDFPLRWSLVKAGFSRTLDRYEHIRSSRARKRERGIWQRRYWEHQVRDDADLGRHVDYIHINPVKHGYVATPTAWPHSSLHRYIRQGLLPRDWAADINELDTGFGERV
jgi:putative transposase